MLNTIRKAADTIIFRVIIGMLAIAFAFWGVDDILRSRNNFDVVTFKHAENISEEEFSEEKAREIAIVQRSQGVNLTEDQIRQSGINEIVLDRLVSSRLLKQLAIQYELDFSEKTLADFIKQQEVFKNIEGKFDINIFKAALKYSGMTEDEFTRDTHNRLIGSALLNAFMRASYVPDAAVQNVAEFMSEERDCTIATIDLSSIKYAPIVEPDDGELEEFYKANSVLFSLPEKRSLSYLVINDSSLKKNINVSESDARQFYDDNKDELESKPFAKVKEQIVSLIKNRRAEEGMMELAKKLEDEVAAGTSLNEIATNLDLKTIALSKVTAEGLAVNKTLGALSDTIFSMHSGEVSYPLELNDPKTMAIVEVTEIAESKVQSFDKVKQLANQKWKEARLKSLNRKIIEDFAAAVKPEDFKESAQKLNLNLADLKLKRSQLTQNNKFSADMLVGIFTANKGVVPQVYSSDQQAYVILLKEVKHDPEAKKMIIKESGETIAQQIRNGLLQEIMSYIRTREDVKINFKDKVLEQ